MKATVLSARALSPEARARWAALQEAHERFSSPFYRPEYTRAVAAVRDDIFVAELEADGTPVGFFPFQRSKHGLGFPPGGGRTNYDGPIIDPAADWDPRELVRSSGLRAYRFRSAPALPPLSMLAGVSRDESSTLALEDGFDAYRAALKAAGSKVVSKTEAQARRLARNVGEVSFETELTDPELLRLLLRWKSAQWRRSGEIDRFEIPANVALTEHVHRLREPSFRGVLSGLRAGREFVALTLVLQTRRTWHGWLIGYDRRFQTYSPGMILLLRLIEDATAREVRLFDLGPGDVGFKSRLRSGVVPLLEGQIIASPLVGSALGLRSWLGGASGRAPLPRPMRRVLQRAHLVTGGSARL